MVGKIFSAIKVMAATSVGFTPPRQITGPRNRAYYNWFRNYDASVGRDIENDPIGLRGGINIFAYAKNNSMRFVDRNGLLFIDPTHQFPDDTTPPPPSPPINIVHGTPKDSCTCQTASGTTFAAPPGTNYTNVQNAALMAGMNPFAVNAAVGHFGTFDFQRNSATNSFTGAYTNAANFSVGVYMQGAGYSLDDTIAIGEFFSNSMSSNAGDPQQKAFWIDGWNAANSGNLEGTCK